MKNLGRFAKPYRLFALLAPPFMLIEAAMDLLQPTLMALAVDQGIAKGNFAYVAKIGSFMLGAAALGALGGSLCAYFASKFSGSYGAALREALFNRIQNFSFANLEKFSSGSLITRVSNDVAQVQNAALMNLRIMVRAPLMAIGGMLLALHASVRLSSILMVLVPMLLLLFVLFVRTALPLFKQMQREIDNVNTVIQENLSGARVVKVFNAQTREIERFREVNAAYSRMNFQVNKILAFASPLIGLLTNMGIALTLFIGLRLGLKSSIEIGQVMAFLQYVMQTMMGFAMAAMSLVFISRAKAGSDRILEVFNEKIDIVDGPASQTLQEGSVSFKNVYFSYAPQSKQNTLQDINLDIKSGQFLALIGSTGSGKSALAQLIPRFYDISQGRLEEGGLPAASYKLLHLRQKISAVLQDSVLFSGTIADNIRWGKADATQEEIERACRTAQAHDFIVADPRGYNRVLGQRGAGLSGGQKQRVCIARALIKSPKILILDDAGSALDLKTEADLYKALQSSLGSITCIMIAQRVSAVKRANLIAVADHGRIAAIGSHEELLAASPIYKEICESQNQA